MALHVKRVYDSPSSDVGTRVLVDRFWPRGLAKEETAIDRWLKGVAPSDGLRRWFGHDLERWEGFQARYRAEIEDPEAAEELLGLCEGGRFTLLYAARDTEQNNAVALKAWWEKEHLE